MKTYQLILGIAGGFLLLQLLSPLATSLGQAVALAVLQLFGLM